jgi:hypothetical protein
LEARIAAREEAAPEVAIFDRALVNVCDSSGGSPEFFLDEPDDDDI